ncbi:DNA-binding response regulator [Aquaticitalea lipolytica]|uniref:DNA-binding response regulator n=1 Tax=Aquaticitalea lipolytica TaxID=1247562 RepID=A0A8J2TRZ7_9FLAO|nr:response regulator transcription factor [Aquaticitalea lipolytica]GFZ83468.1 DNA-binding response regulator [Aquaticitalea lipolytica]
MLKIITADDHPLILKGLSDFLIEKIKNVEIFQARNGEEVLKILKGRDIDLVILDLEMPILSGLETLKIITTKFPKTKVIIMTFDKDINSVKATLLEGALGYIYKEFALTEILQAIDEVRKGKFYYQKEISDALINEYKNSLKNEFENKFTSREVEVLKLISEGLSGKEISEILSISPRTVETHKRSLMTKTGTSNTILLVRYAIENKLL